MPLSLAYLPTDRRQRIARRIARRLRRIAPQLRRVARRTTRLLGLDLPLRVEVRLVAGERDHDVRVACRCSSFTHCFALERVPVRDVVHHDGGGGAAVVVGASGGRSCPAVSQISNLTVVSLSATVTVERRADRGPHTEELPAHEAQHEHDLPTALSPSSTSLNWKTRGRHHGLEQRTAPRGGQVSFASWNQRPRTRRPVLDPELGSHPPLPRRPAHAPPAGRPPRPRGDDARAAARKKSLPPGAFPAPSISAPHARHDERHAAHHPLRLPRAPVAAARDKGASPGERGGQREVVGGAQQAARKIHAGATAVSRRLLLHHQRRRNLPERAQPVWRAGGARRLLHPNRRRLVARAGAARRCAPSATRAAPPRRRRRPAPTCRRRPRRRRPHRSTAAAGRAPPRRAPRRRRPRRAAGGARGAPPRVSWLAPRHASTRLLRNMSSIAQLVARTGGGGSAGGGGVGCGWPRPSPACRKSPIRRRRRRAPRRRRRRAPRDGRTDAGGGGARGARGRGTDAAGARRVARAATRARSRTDARRRPLVRAHCARGRDARGRVRGWRGAKLVMSCRRVLDGGGSEESADVIT